MNWLRVTLLGVACALPALSLAQWQWIDKDGHKVFSDQSPPADIPAKDIIRRPGVKGAAAIEPAEAAASQPARPAAPAPRLSGKDPGLEQKLKAAEAAETEKKKANEEQIAKARAENCERARNSKAAFDSGVRITRTNAKGEREYIDDAARAAETRRLAAIIATDCGTAGAQ